MTTNRLGLPLLPRWLRWAGVAAVAAFIFYVSIVTAPPETTIVPGKPDLVPLDKWRHFLAYAALGGAVFYATVDWDRSTRVVAGVGLLVVVAYGVGIEVGQSAIPDRYFSVGDAYANALGGVLSLPVFLLRNRIPFVPVDELVGRIRR